MRRAARKTRDGVELTARDTVNRAHGLAARVRGLSSADTATDKVLAARIRARIGRVCSHPRAIDVQVRDGEVRLHGQVLAAEVEDVVNSAAAVRGVTTVEAELDVHATADGVPALQGKGRIAGASLDLFQSTWAPATRALVGVGLLAAAAWAATVASRGRTRQGAVYGTL